MERFHWVSGAPQYCSGAFVVTDLDTRWRCDNSSVYPQAAFGGNSATEARSNPLQSYKENGLLLQFHPQTTTAMDEIKRPHAHLERRISTNTGGYNCQHICKCLQIGYNNSTWLDKVEPTPASMSQRNDSNSD